jgi:hypothetical protein
VAVAGRPEGPFEDALGRPLIDRFHNGAQPIDPFVFAGADGTYWLIYGGWRHCNIGRLNDDFSGLAPSHTTPASPGKVRRSRRDCVFPR